MTDRMQTIHRKLCLEFSEIKVSFTAFSIQCQAQRHVCQRHAKMFSEGDRLQILPMSLSELTDISEVHLSI